MSYQPIWPDWCVASLDLSTDVWEVTARGDVVYIEGLVVARASLEGLLEMLIEMELASR